MGRVVASAALALLLVLAAFGCRGSIHAYAADERPLVDRRHVEYPTGLQLSIVADDLTAASAVAAGPDGLLYVADYGYRGERIRITRIDPDSGALRQLYPPQGPLGRRVFGRPAGLYGPAGGMAVHAGELLVSARDERDRGVVVAFDLASLPDDDEDEDRQPAMRTIVGELPAQGDHGVTALAIHPQTGRVFFGLGSATNSGVVGVDNWEAGWLKNHPNAHDLPLGQLKIFGYRFDTEDPQAGFLRPDKVNTAPFNPFGQSDQRIPAAEDAKPTAALYSVDPRGGDLRVEAHGIRHPRGLAFSRYANLYAANQGMELRGTRPVKDDPDVLLRIPLSAGFGPFIGQAPATWFGWPDYSADLRPITDPSLQPPAAMLGRTGYRELSPLIDTQASDLRVADRESLLVTVFPSLSGASGLTFVPEEAPGFDMYRDELIVALYGDRAPFATSGLPLKRPIGRSVMAVDPERQLVEEIIFNTVSPGEAGDVALDRPIDVTFGPDGALYVLDAGEMRMRNGIERYHRGTGKLYRLAPPPEPAESPATAPSAETQPDSP